MGTGGVASGGTEVLATFRQEVAASGIAASVKEHCSTHQVGCRGLCAKDVLVDVAIDNEKVTGFVNGLNVGVLPPPATAHVPRRGSNVKLTTNPLPLAGRA